MDHLEPVRQKIRSAQIVKAPWPWKHIKRVDVGGLMEINFSDDSSWLLACSLKGRGVFDCRTGERVSRDHSFRRDVSWYEPSRLTALGIGPLQGQWIRLSGIHGGGLSTFTEDGWQAVRLAIDWPNESLLLVEPNSSIYQLDARFTKLALDSEVPAFGFSLTGKTLVIATSSDLTLIGRD